MGAIRCLSGEGNMKRTTNKTILCYSLGVVLLAVSSLPQQASAKVQWWHKMVGATDKNQNTLKYGNGVRVGIIDGTAFGVNAAGNTIFIHPDFGNRMDSRWGYPTAPGNWSNYSTIGDDHGTHVAGIVGAGADGVGMRGIAPGVRFTSVGVFDNNGFVGSTMDALKITAESGGTIANMSYGPVAAGVFMFNDYIEAVLKYKKKVFVSKSAGNDGVTLKTLTSEKALVNMIIVGAVNENKKIAGFSNRPGEGCFQLTAGPAVKRQSQPTNINIASWWRLVWAFCRRKQAVDM
ncbi:MAG: hypothetical protein FJX44_00240 [Alphaproteobacteria bacterium]|nr:hypothetical protein [Alphaproteobacteria bacterium]